MPNAFVVPMTPAGTSSSLSPAIPPINLPLYDPRFARDSRQRFYRDDIPELMLANSLYQPTGRWPARGWILLRRGDYNQITNLYRTDFQLEIDDFANGGLVFTDLAIVQAQCVTRGIASDPNAIYLVEFTDNTGVLWNPWTTFPTSSQYNIRAPAYPETFYANSLNGGVPWTWSTMIGDLWGQMGTQLGGYPGLPIVPSGTPEGYLFPGMSCWEAMNRVLNRLGLTVSRDLTQGGPYGIVQVGAADAAFVALQTKFAKLLEDDYEFIDAGSARIAGKICVFFHRRNQYYGTEETVRNDSLQWSSTPLYKVTVPGPVQFSAAAGTHYVWSEFTVRFDIDGNPLAADVATAAAIAAERASQYYTRASRGTLGFLRQVYAGALPFAAGRQVDGVRWFMDFRRGDFGWCTEIVRGAQPPWPQVNVRVEVDDYDEFNQ